jgi:signal transduction histidine kinase/response regulator of citrate/malate metabolism
VDEAVMTDAILILDHDQDFAQAIAEYLKRRQFEVLIPATPQDAEKVFKSRFPEIILADPELLETDGVSLIHRLKSSRRQTQVIIVATADHIEKYMEIFHDDVIGYITKPIKGIALDLALKQARNCYLMQKKIDSYTRRLEDLHNAEILYHQLFDEVPCYITVQDRHHRMTATNRLFKQDFGQEIGEHCFKIYKHRESPCPNCPVTATFKDGQHHHTEEVVTSKSGVQYNVLTYTAPIRNELNEITQVIEMATNITQIRQLQDHLTSLGLMLGSISHSVKGMLSALDGGIYLLETGISKKDNRRIHRAYDNLREMVDRIRKMVLDILFFAKTRELKYQKTKVSDIEKRVVETIKPVTKQHGIELKTASAAKSLGAIMVDPEWLPASLINILDNAVDSCVSDTTKKKHQIDFKVYSDRASRVCFEIKDNGVGMDRETREKMFSLFFSSKGSKGTGLGLYIVNNVVQQHGGAITVESTPGKGARFIISLPRSRTHSNNHGI